MSTQAKIDSLRQQVADADKLIFGIETNDPHCYYSDIRIFDQREKIARRLLREMSRQNTPPTVLSVRAIVGVVAMFLTLTLIARLVGR